MPKLPRVGPMARMSTGLDSWPEMTKPAMVTESPVPTRARVEILARRCAPKTASVAPVNVVAVEPDPTTTVKPEVSGAIVATMDWRAVVIVMRLLPSREPEPPSDVVDVWTRTKA